MVAKLDAKERLDELKGQKLSYLCRSCDLFDIGFGKSHERELLSGKKITTASYAIHVQCPFRITNQNNVIMSYDDMFVPLDDSIGTVDVGLKNTTLLDSKLRAFFSQYPNEYVLDVALGDYGDLTIFMSNICISLVVTRFDKDEAWRFFKPGSEEEHLVTTGRNFNFE